MGRINKKKTAKAKKPIKKKQVEEDLLPDMGNDPFFAKKAEEARKALKESGFIFTW